MNTSANYALVLDLSEGFLIALYSKTSENPKIACHYDPSKRKGDQIEETLCQLLTQSQLKIDDIGEINVGTGPGSFTGIRIALAFVQGFCSGGDIKLRAISSLGMRRASLTASIEDWLLVPARKGWYYCAGHAKEVILSHADVLELQNQGLKFHHIGDVLEAEGDLVIQYSDWNLQALERWLSSQPFCSAKQLRPNYLMESSAESKLKGH